ncbi:MAG: hypothetical protein H0T62_04840 [Parachlamydiaceae bacterium]|nr:hypothetical protein [Parachlamydiaceae bacterium]
MEDKFSHQEVLRHLVELKYQTTGRMQPRGFKEASVDVIKHSRLAFETTSKDQSKPTKPVTLHLFVDQPTYESMRIEDDEGRLKGVFGNSWSLSDLESLAKTDDKIQRVYGQITDHLTEVLLRDGDCQNEQISTLELNVYKSARSAIKFNNKYVLLVGDAESGLVLERGFNKGLKGAAICAQAVSTYFQNENLKDEGMPESFVSYENETLEIFESELRFAKIKNVALNTVEKSLNGSRMVKETSFKMSETSSNASSKVFSSSKWDNGNNADTTSSCIVS